jgi:hypothetical protein
MVGRIDSNGIYRAPATVPSPAIVNVGAVSFEDQKLSATSATTILPPPTVTISPTCMPTPCVLTSGAANTQAFTATVTGATTTNVDWFVNGVLGGNSASGTISATGVYTAPNTPPIGSTVTVTVESHDFPLAVAHAMVAITGYSTSSFQGSFAFSMTGTNASGAFSRAGSFTADGAGHLSGGLEDVNAASCVTANPISFVGTYAISLDGRGTMTFADGCTPATFSIVLVNNNQLQFTGFDTAGTASGQANLQDLAAFSASGLIGTYIFDFTGEDGSSNFLSQIGEFTADGLGGITNGLVDAANEAGVIPAQAPFTGTYQVNSNGRGTATFGSSHFIFYVVSRGSAKFVGTDATLVVAGLTTQQDPNAIFNLASLNGNFTFLLSGPGGTGNVATAGSFTADANGHLTAGAMDQNVNGTPTTNVVFSNGSYTVASNGRGTATFTTTTNQNFVFYLTAAGSAVFQQTDPGVASDGILTEQQNPAFAEGSTQSYALQTSGHSASSLQTIAGSVVAVIANDGTASLSGIVDINTAGATASEAVTGMYSSPAANGRAILQFNPSTDNRTFAIYVVNSMQIFVIGIDPALAARVASGAMYRRF